MNGDVLQIDRIICPMCGQVCEAEVTESWPWPSFTHQCEHCGYWIMESEWELVLEEEKGE